MSSTRNSENPLTSQAWGASQSSNHFGHPLALQVSLAGMLIITMATGWFMLQVPFVNVRYGLFLLPLTLCTYLAHRLYLTLFSVEFFSDHIDIQAPGKKDSVPYTAIRKVWFDSFSHDMMLRDDTRQYRIPRTIEGHRVILHRLHERAELERDHSPEMQISVRTMPKIVCLISLAAMLMLAMRLNMEVAGLGYGLLLLFLPATYMLFNQCVLRRYRFTPDALYVRGIRGEVVFPRGELIDTSIAKSGLSSCFEMKFNSGTVQFDEYLLSKALIQVSGYVERQWQHRVRPVSQKASS